MYSIYEYNTYIYCYYLHMNLINEQDYYYYYD